MSKPLHDIPRATLVPGYGTSRIIKGGWQLAGGHGSTDPQQAVQDMGQFVEAGITTFDCADIYTGVEELIGAFRKQYAQLRGIEALQNIKVHTKFVPDMQMLPHMTREYVRSIIVRSLQRLGVERLDLVQFHWWNYDVAGYIETAGYLSELQNEGMILNLGLTNFDVVRIKEMTGRGTRFLTNQVQYSLLDRRPEHALIQFCKESNMHLLCYGTVAGGFLSDKYLGAHEPQEPFENRSLVKYKLIIDDFGGWGIFQELLKVLSAIAQKHDVDIATVATRYVLERPAVAAVIVGARNAKHLHNHQKLFGFALDGEDYVLIHRVLDKARQLPGDIYSLERNSAGKHASIMKYNLNKHE